MASPLYGAFTSKLEILLQDLIKAYGLKSHSITSRLKTYESLEIKIVDNLGKYQSLSDITDISGLRIVTYFEDDARRISEIIEREFIIDKENSSDRRDSLDPDRFGYLSIHYVLALTEARSTLTEYKPFAAQKAELQVRSILQHAWAEIEHDLGYKSTVQVPREIRRRFSRVSGLLELVDQEFIEIRKQLTVYAKNVPAAIEKNPNEVEINNESIASYMSHSEVLARIDAELAVAGGGDEISSGLQLVGTAVEILTALRMSTIAQADEALKENAELVIALGREFLKDKKAIFSKGIGFLYLSYVVVTKTDRVEEVLEFLNAAHVATPENREEFANEILGIMRMIKARKNI